MIGSIGTMIYNTLLELMTVSDPYEPFNRARNQNFGHPRGCMALSGTHCPIMTCMNGTSSLAYTRVATMVQQAKSAVSSRPAQVVAASCT